MNDGKPAYYPVLLYSLLLLLVWGGSWLVELVLLFAGESLNVNSLVSGEGVRWALLNAEASLEAAPWGTAFFLLFVVGLLHGSGLLRLTGNMLRGRASSNELRSLLFALLSLMLYATVLFLFTVSPWNALCSVTGSIYNSSFSHGWMLVFFAGVLMMSLVYGFVYGNYRTVVDVVGSAAGFVRMFLPALLAMLPASGIMPCLRYTGLDVAMGVEGGVAVAVEVLLYCLPFVYVAILCLIRKR